MALPEKVSNDNSGIQLTLPSRCFTDPGIYAREEELIFRRCWQPAGYSEDVAGKGDFITARIAGHDVAIVRGRDGVLRAFFNVCQHRGHRLLKGKGNLKVAITCPYHAWAYGLDGALRAAPNADNVCGFDSGTVSLQQVAVDEVGPMVLVCLDRDVDPFDVLYPDVRQEFQAFVPRMGEVAFHRRSSAVLACNWKVAVENYGECYHCRHAHPTLVSSLIDADSYRVELFEWHHRHSSGSVPVGVTLYEVNPDVGDQAANFANWLIWPNYSFQVNPGSNVVVFHFMPNGPESTIANIDWFFGPWVAEAERDRVVDDHARTTLQEDVDLVEEVQIGLNNLGYDRGVLMVDKNQTTAGHSEHSVAHWQNLWRTTMGENEHA
ncbi:MAG: aromatic ring-hydroxylating dioxygenase subunit alpha [Alphaproteobacteria bacterium]|jgi:carnitine monooxygenase subunit|nr:aromatic ring-hydroxylating dioxygenase subunit alpha [Rhodospirillaceae bacterium]MBT7612946.1 aromatic ring-hydroxylating dioxygenase subunit alpha [Rhodospirillaceae bacterium]MBT7647484.1 aromatic ring-hydroxylating dioxygenase subunit alpha [Rhodospirillaceae bacterium]MDG2479305.1 aromatic ring-hydroxylating dioxygenase subunit alpha [Alphaproteobacteria bacterium]